MPIILLYGSLAIEYLDQMGIRIEGIETLFLQPGRSSIHRTPRLLSLNNSATSTMAWPRSTSTRVFGQPGRYQADGAVVTNPEKNPRREQ